MNARGAQCDFGTFLLQYTYLKMALLLHKIALIIFPMGTTVYAHGWFGLVVQTLRTEPYNPSVPFFLGFRCSSMGFEPLPFQPRQAGYKGGILWPVQC